MSVQSRMPELLVIAENARLAAQEAVAGRGPSSPGSRPGGGLELDREEVERDGVFRPLDWTWRAGEGGAWGRDGGAGDGARAAGRDWRAGCGARAGARRVGRSPCPALAGALV